MTKEDIEQLEQLISKTVAETVKQLNIETEAIVESVVERVNKDNNVLAFKDKEQMEKFEDAVPKLIALDESVETAKKRGKWVLIIIAGYILKDFYEFFTHIGKVLMDLASTDVATILKHKGK